MTSSIVVRYLGLYAMSHLQCSCCTTEAPHSVWEAICRHGRMLKNFYALMEAQLVSEVRKQGKDLIGQF